MNELKKQSSLLVLAYFCIACASKQAVPEVGQALQKDGWELVWSDEFDKDGLPDEKKWSYDVGDACDRACGCGWGNHELQYYTERRQENARVENGLLVIELHQEPYKTREYTSARLTTKNKGDWKYGRFDIRAKLPEELGVWSAIWMLSTDDVYNGWPHSGEIDIMENVGYESDSIVGTAHTLSYHHLIGTHKKAKFYNPNPSESFHLYSMEWDEKGYHLFVDNQKYFSFLNEGTGSEAWPFDQRFHLLLNLAFGGDWGGSHGIDPESLPTAMYIDYVRVYQKPNQVSLKLEK